LKYSCCLYPTGKESLEQAEVEMLESYVEKAALVDGMEILDLGCGWGSLSLFLAEVNPAFGERAHVRNFPSQRL
jgi:cation-transporting ATPase 13A3/4/5